METEETSRLDVGCSDWLDVENRLRTAAIKANNTKRTIAENTAMPTQGGALGAMVKMKAGARFDISALVAKAMSTIPKTAYNQNEAPKSASEK